MFPDRIFYTGGDLSFDTGGLSVDTGGLSFDTGGLSFDTGGVCAVLRSSFESHLRWMFSTSKFCPISCTDHMQEPYIQARSGRNKQHRTGQ